jgi:peptidoglycan/LPS O-acetylase OafA/YrhL
MSDIQPTSPILRSLSSFVDPVGTEAVILFFVLSGFVLSLPAVREKAQSYFTFVIRRVFRIYVPYLAALAVSVAGALWLHGAITKSDWFNRSWSEAVNWQLVGRHLLFLGVFDTNQFDNPIWSLIHEMRISLVFPLLCALVLRIGTRRSLVLALGLSCAAIFFELKPFMIDSDLAGSLHYAAFFVLGILLARHTTGLGAWFSRRRKLMRTLALVAALVLFLFAGPQILQHFSRPSHYWRNKPLSDWITALGAGGLILISMNSQACKRVLFWSPIRFLGEVSYSLYLWHFIVMLYCVHLLYGKVHLAVILSMVFVLSLLVSWCSYRWIELPSIALGRRLGDIRLTRLSEVKLVP